MTLNPRVNGQQPGFVYTPQFGEPGKAVLSGGSNAVRLVTKPLPWISASAVVLDSKRLAQRFNLGYGTVATGDNYRGGVAELQDSLEIILL